MYRIPLLVDGDGYGTPQRHAVAAYPFSAQQESDVWV